MEAELLQKRKVDAEIRLEGVNAMGNADKWIPGKKRIPRLPDISVLQCPVGGSSGICVGPRTAGRVSEATAVDEAVVESKRRNKNGGKYFTTEEKKWCEQ